MTTLDGLSALERATRLLEAQLRHDPDPHVVSVLLREAWPAATAAACRLGRRSPVAVAGLDETAAHELDRLNGPEEETLWTRHLKAKGKAVCVAADDVLMALVLESTSTGEQEGIARLALTALARQVALHTLRGQLHVREQEVGELERLANVGEMAGVLTHEFTDFLNMLLLHVAVLEYRLPEAERDDLAEIRRHGNRAASLINQFQQYRRTASSAAVALDLVEIVRSVAEQLSEEFTEPLPVALVNGEERPEGEVVCLRLEQGTALPAVRGHDSDVRRLVRFLMGNSIRAAAEAGREVRVTTTVRDKRAQLRIEDSAPVMPPVDLANLLNPSAPQRDGVDGVELAACRSLARRLRSGLQVTARPEGGVQIVVDFGSEQSS